MTQPFWKSKSLAQMSHDEWESLCDGCGLCCLNKLIDDENESLYYTNVACHLLDCNTGKCSNYAQRKQYVRDCIELNIDNLQQAQAWLPNTCAYKRLYQGKDLPHWHPLVNPQKPLGYSVANRCRSEKSIKDCEEHIVPLSHFKMKKTL